MQELRYLEGKELRAIGDSGEPLKVEGYAAVFNQSAKLPGFEERIKPGAFTRSIGAGSDVVFLVNHNSDFPLARSSAGTLRLKQDSRGLHFSADLPNTQLARDTHELIRTGALKCCSFGFIVGKDGQTWSEGRHEDGTYFVQRDLVDIDRLTDVSSVTWPAYDGTTISARADEVPAELRSAVDLKNAAIVVPDVRSEDDEEDDDDELDELAWLDDADESDLTDEQKEIKKQRRAIRSKQEADTIKRNLALIESDPGGADPDAWLTESIKRSAKVAQEVAAYKEIRY